jgi:hypothetical protein
MIVISQITLAISLYIGLVNSLTIDHSPSTFKTCNRKMMDLFPPSYHLLLQNPEFLKEQENSFIDQVESGDMLAMIQKATEDSVDEGVELKTEMVRRVVRLLKQTEEDFTEFLLSSRLKISMLQVF